MPTPVEIRRLAAADVAMMRALNALFGEADDPAIALYERLGEREEVLHFDIPVGPPRR